MQKQKQNKVVQLNIQPLHTYMVKEDDYASTDEVKINLISGQAEIIGMQLKKHYPLKFKMPCIIPIFTWEGCEIKVQWPEEKSGRSSDEWCDITINNHLPESPMIKYLTLHFELTTARKLAHEELKNGPRLAIVGGENSGANIASKLMLNYTGKLNMRPIFIDLDIENSIFLDGCIGGAAYQYKVTSNDDIFEKNQKIIYVYGNRKIKKMSYLKMVGNLAKLTNLRMNTQIQSVKWKGCKHQISSFASGLIVQCPKITAGSKEHKELLAELLVMFDISHVLIIDNPDISSFLTRSCPIIKRYNASRIEGVEALLKLPKKKKINDYLGADNTELLTVNIDDIPIYELNENDMRPMYVRRIDIKTEHVNKTAVCILKTERKNNWNEEEIAKQITQSTVIYACRISKIGENDVTFEIPFVQNFWEECKNKLWVSMIAQKNN